MTPDPLPKRWRWLVRGFRRYVPRFLRKNFHAVRLSKAGAIVPTDGRPLLVVMNHPSWWDPMMAVALADLFPGFDHFGAIDARMLKVYRVFTRLGFFGIDMASLAGAREFLRTGTAVLARDRHAVWVTAQGAFADVRTRPLGLKPGVGHLAARLERGWVLPIALEYVFWNERKPEALARVGEPISLESGLQPIFMGESMRRAEARAPAKSWTSRIEAALAATLDALSGEAQSRNPSLFTTLIGS